MADLVLPQLGETVTEGTITRWFKGVGDAITVDELLYEVSTDKVDSEVPSPMAGLITEILVPEGETVVVGTVLAIVEVSHDVPGPDTDPGAPAPAPAADPAAAEPAAAERRAPPPPAAAPAAVRASEPASYNPANVRNGRLSSPVVRRLIREHNLDSAALVGTGVGGRISRADVLNAIDELGRAGLRDGPDASVSSPAAAKPPTPTRPMAPAPVAAAAAAEWTDGDSRFEPFNNIRRRTGEHMVRSVSISPHALTVMEVDYENVEQVRRAHREAWRAGEGYSLTYLPFIVASVVDALRHWPRLNASVSDGGLRIHRRRNVGVAVDLDYDGLIVPVLRDADSLSVRGIARSMNELAQRARERRLGPDDISGGTFTISNNGSFGTYTTAAIINQPQVAVLSTDGVARRPVVVSDRFGNESIVVHSVGHLAMGWDHRAFDGSYAAGFLGHIKRMLEDHDWGAEL